MPWSRRRLGSWIACVAVGIAAAAGCNIFPLAQGPRPDSVPGAPSKYSTRVSQFLFYHDFELSRKEPLFKELSLLREQVYKDLQLPPASNLVQVYLFENRDQYERFMKQKHPDLPIRRAFFVVQPRLRPGNEDLLVYTYWSDNVQKDVRHELTHALLHSVLKDVPIWLDEGLAEYFEMPPGWNGINYQHLEQLLRGPSGRAKFSLDRLETLEGVQQMNHPEYRESWAWVHFMIKGPPQARQVLLGYLQELRTTNKPGPVRPRLEKVVLSLDAALERHLANLDLSQAKPEK